MKDITKILLEGLVSALSTATGETVYLIVPKSATYPYIHISDVFIQEDGPKDNYNYNANILIEIVHKDLKDLDLLLTDKDNVMSIIKSQPFSLDSPYKISQIRLNTNTHQKVLRDTGEYMVGIVRLIIDVI